MAKNTNIQNDLHIKLVNDPSIKYDLDKNYGVLQLPKAGAFSVTIEEYDKKIKEAETKHTEAGKLAQRKWKERAQAGWSKEKLNENWKANEKQRDTNYSNTVTAINAEFKDVNWAWVTAGKKITPDELSHNASFKKGLKGTKIVNFPKVLEGGGMAYLEAFNASNGPKGKKPFGMFVKAIGQPEILRVEWTDFDYNPLKGKIVAFGSEVLLHVYTRALYGQEVTINLFDEDIFKDDELNIASKSAFQREVDIHLVHPKEIGKEGIADTLTKADQSKTDNVIEKEHYIQKVTIEVKVDYAWMKSAGEHLKIYPTVKSLKTEKYFEKFSREFLEVAMNGTLYDTPKDITNKPVVVSQIETNASNYHPCHYKTIDYINDKSETVNLFTEEPGVEKNTNHEIGIIVGSDPKKFSIKVNDDVETKDCLFEDKPNDHEKNIFSYDKTKLPANFIINIHSQKRIEGNASFNYDNNILNYIWPSASLNDNLSSLLLKSQTCRYQHHININLYPDIVWSLAFTFALKNPLAFTHSNLDAGRIFKEAQDKARKSGYDRFRLSQGGSVPDEFSLSLKTKHTKIENTAPPIYKVEEEHALKYAKKISDFMEILLKIKEIAEKVKKTAGGSAKSAVPGMPFSFEVMSPKLGVTVDWKAELIRTEISTTGVLKLTADPLVGAEFTIDMLAVAGKLHPVVQIIKSSVDTGLEALGGYMILEAKLYGQLNITVEAFKVNTITGVSAGSKPLMILGKMGVKLIFQLKAKGKIEAFGLAPIDISFEAEAKVDAYFGGTFLIENDDKGAYLDLTGQFSGLLLTLKVEAKIGKYTKKINVNNEPIFPSDKVSLGKQYIIQ